MEGWGEIPIHPHPTPLPSRERERQGERCSNEKGHG